MPLGTVCRSCRTKLIYYEFVSIFNINQREQTSSRLMSNFATVSRASGRRNDTFPPQRCFFWGRGKSQPKFFLPSSVNFIDTVVADLSHCGNILPPLLCVFCLLVFFCCTEDRNNSLFCSCQFVQTICSTCISTDRLSERTEESLR